MFLTPALFCFAVLQVTENWAKPGGEAMSLSCNCFNLNVVNRVVKLSSPNLNILIIAGAILLYVSVFLYVFSVDDMEEALTQTILCNVRWLFKEISVQSMVHFYHK